MNLENFLNKAYGKSIMEDGSFSEQEQTKETEKFIKNLKKVRFNAMFTNLERISLFMKEQGATVRGLVKKTILEGAMSLFKQSRERSQKYRKQKDDIINKSVDIIIDTYKTEKDKNNPKSKVDTGLEQSIASLLEKVAYEQPIFDKVIERIYSATFPDASKNEQLTFFITQFLKTDQLESPEERKYHDRALELIEYFVIQTMLLRIVLSSVQTLIARIVSKIKLSKVPDAKRKSEEIGKMLIGFFKDYVENRFGSKIGVYLSTYVSDYYQSSKDRKEQFIKFENLINIILGIK